MSQGKQIDGVRVLPLQQLNFQISHETRDRHPEVIPHEYDALHTATVTVPQCLDQVTGGLAAMSVEPLFELIDH